MPAAVDSSINSRRNRAASRVARRAGTRNSVAARQRTLNCMLYLIVGVCFDGNHTWEIQMVRQCRAPLPLHNEKALLQTISILGDVIKCQHCGAYFWLEEKRTGLSMSAAPQYQRCCVGGRAALQSDLGEVGANQYELPAGDSIGAIVYEGGPETMTDYDIVIERHSREPESVNKLHPRYMALQFPLLFIYGEEGYHLKLTLRNSVPGDQQEEKKMSMKSPFL
ncbi:replication protein [Artemisia annua]|uniref:Replication protein n=1 Tax=Artemisia annua TaxID=35608 RepID=A0A2U1NAM3_ARTAN|nr:replication protein [Artemisia annua]